MPEPVRPQSDLLDTVAAFAEAAIAHVRDNLGASDAAHTEMLLLRAIGATPMPRWVKPGILDQLDLLAMHNRYTIKRGETDEASGWVWVSFSPDACGCGTEPSDA